MKIPKKVEEKAVSLFEDAAFLIINCPLLKTKPRI